MERKDDNSLMVVTNVRVGIVVKHWDLVQLAAAWISDYQICRCGSDSARTMGQVLTLLRGVVSVNSSSQPRLFPLWSEMEFSN
jgi:hypothetical protein